MKNSEYVWIINRDFHSKVVFRFPFQVRKYAKQNGFSIYDETYTDIDTIIFSKRDGYKGEIGFYATRRKIA